MSLRLFVVHAPDDTWFVNGFLLKAVPLPEDEVLVSSNLEPGAMIVQEIERGALSPVTVVVVSPSFLASPWMHFAHQLAMTHSIEPGPHGGSTLIPAFLADCEFPLMSRLRVALDFRNHQRDRWEVEAAKLRKKLSSPAPDAVTLPCPYPGIRPFTADDAARFHGRTQEIRELLRRLRDGHRELYVIGPSGCGKSSLVAAGLVPGLGAAPALAGGHFLVRSMRPGVDPIGALASALDAPPVELRDPALRWLGDAASRLLASHPPHDRLLIIVDPLEELFTSAHPGERDAFIAAVGAMRGNDQIALLFTLRADFYASLMESALWDDLDGRLSRLDVAPLRGDKLRVAMESPARALGVYFEPGLVERLLHDTADEPGALPLLQDTLFDLWHQRTHHALRLAEYEALGDGERTGLAVSLARRADVALAELDPACRDIARRVLLRLVLLGDGVTATRRQQPRSAFATAADTADDIDAVIQHLANRRLITTSGGDGASPSPRVDLAHEILLSAWPTLSGWIQSRRDDEQRRRDLEAKAGQWMSSGGRRSRLLDADELREVDGWLSDDKARDLGISEDLRRLLGCSRQALAAERTAAEQRRRRWRRWRTTAFVGLMAAVLTVSSLAALVGRRSREVSEQALELRQQLARSYVAQGLQRLLASHPEQAAPYLVAARESGLGNVPLRMLFRWARDGLPALRLEHGGPVSAVAWSPDGKLLATASEDRTARIWDASGGRTMTPPLTHQASVTVVAWSPDGKRVATASEDRAAQIWDVVTGQPMTPPLLHRSAVVALAWSPDGGHLATVGEDKLGQVWDAVSGQPIAPPLPGDLPVTTVAWSPDGTRLAVASGDTARIWSCSHGQFLPPLAHQAEVRAVAWSPDGTRLATASKDGTARIWEAGSGHPVTPPLSHRGEVGAVTWSPDGTRVATASDDRTARVWDAVTGQPITTELVHRLTVATVAWSPDGTRVATASWDQTARVWDAASGQPVTPPLPHRALVLGVAWSPDGTRIATASSDQAARVWDVVGRVPLAPPLAHGDKLAAVAWSPDGRRVATASLDHTARIWNADDGRPAGPPLVHRSAVAAVAWDPAGTRVATASADWTARIWDTASGRLMTLPLVHQNTVSAVAWSPDGTRVATASWDQTSCVWDAASGQLRTPPMRHGGKVRAIAWSLDGTRVATASDDRTALVWDAITGQPMTTPLSHGGGVASVAWSPDGTRIATASDDGTARVWSATRGLAVTPPLAHQREVRMIAWRPDGTQVATASADQTARVWDAITGHPVTPPLAHDGPVWTIAWSADGTRLVTGSEDRTVRLWDAATGQPIALPLVHGGAVWALQWSPDGTRVATASTDRTARLWDVSWDTGTLLDWGRATDRGDYRLNEAGILVVRDSPNHQSSKE